MTSSSTQERAHVGTPDAPPLAARLKHDLLGLPPDKRYRGWVEKDLTSRFSIFRGLLPMVMGYLIGGALVSALFSWENDGFFLGSLIGLSIAAFLLSVIPPWRRWMQRRKLDAYEKRWAKKSG
jgi:hypothetical protein